MGIVLKELTYEERSIWGTCPVCDSEPGIPCSPIGAEDIPDGESGAHFARLVNAPEFAAEVE